MIRDAVCFHQVFTGFNATGQDRGAQLICGREYTVSRAILRFIFASTREA